MEAINGKNQQKSINKEIEIINKISVFLTQLYYQNDELKYKIENPIPEEIEFEKFYIISSIWLKKYKNKFNYNKLCKYLSENVLESKKGKKNKRNNFKLIENLENFDELKDKNLFYANKITDHVFNFKYPVDFTIIRENLFELLIEFFNFDLKENYEILFGDDQIFIKDLNNKDLDVYYICNCNDNSYKVQYIIISKEETFFEGFIDKFCRGKYIKGIKLFREKKKLSERHKYQIFS